MVKKPVSVMANTRVIVLDAMGVIYRARDDVAELLVPFVEQQGSGAGPRKVAMLYEHASLGHLEADAFWRALGLDRAWRTTISADTI